MPFCNQCGADVAGVKFCSKCGAPVEASPAAGSSPSEGAATAGAGSSSDVSQNIAAALAYITPVAIVLLLIDPYKSNRFVRFHSFQSIFYFLATFAVYIVFGVLSAILAIIGAGFLAFFFPVLQLLFFVLWILLVIKAYQGQTFKLPVIGDLAQKQV